VFIALVIQHALRMNHVVICGLSGCTLFFTLTHKRHDLKKWLDKNVCFDFLYIFFSEIFFILRRNERDMIKKCIRLHVKYPLFFLDLSETCIFWTDFLKILKNQISRKSDQLDPSSVWRDGRTDRFGEANSFCSFGNAPKNGTGSWYVMPISI